MVMAVGLFLAALLDALGASVQGTLPASFGSQFLASLLLCSRRLVSTAWAGDSLIRAGFRDVENRVGSATVPARFFSWKARSSSSRSLACFLAAFKGLALPPTWREHEGSVPVTMVGVFGGGRL